MRLGSIKLINGNREELIPCTHIQVTRYIDRVQIEVQPDNRMIELPEHGQVVYAMNMHGDTIDSYTWPPKSPKGKEFRTNA